MSGRLSHALLLALSLSIVGGGGCDGDVSFGGLLDAGADTSGEAFGNDPGATAAAECPRVHGAAPPLVSRNDCGGLSYGRYAAQGQEEVIHTLPDFSWAGYMRGGVALPVAQVKVIVKPSEGDDRRRIQEAIDQVSAMPPGPDGLRGAVLLRRGHYEVGGALHITTSGVVLRGEGQGIRDTVLVATHPSKHNFLRIQGEGRGMGEVEGTRVRITTPYVPVGARSFEVEVEDAFEVGDTVAVERTPNQAWIDTLGMEPFGWTPRTYAIGHERVVTEVDGRTITVDIPLVDAVEEAFGGGAVYRADLSGRISQVGVEDLRIVSRFSEPDDDDHGWVAVDLRRTTNSWVRRVTAVHFGLSAVSIDDESSFNTVEDSAMLQPVSPIEGGRRYSFYVDGGTGNLFQRCYSEASRHDFVTGARTTGPNVWLDCFSTRSSDDDGPHHRWSTGILLDNTYSHRLHVENRRDSGTGHGWTGAQVLFWNGAAVGIRCDAPVGSMNWAVGCVGAMNEGRWAPEEPFGWWESHGTPVKPRSLYLAQLADRLGPEAVEAVTLRHQRKGRIWELLAGWAGEGRLEEATPVPTLGDPLCETGVAEARVCCAASCGVCGGAGCSSRPGGDNACCATAIQMSGRSCETSKPPCAL